MPASVYHVYTNPVADGTATSVVRPSDWNSAHAITLAPTGAEIIGAFSNGGNVTFGTNASGYVTATAPAGGGGGGVAFSAGTNSTSTGTVAFVNSNGVSFGMNTNGAVTASYTVPTVPAQTEYQFSNANGVTFGTNASTVTASVQTNYAATDVTTNNVAVSNSSLFQHTSATSAVTANAMNTSERGNYFYSSNNTFANSTHSHGNVAFSGTNISASFTTQSNGLSIQLSAPSVGGAQTGISGLSAGTTQATSGTVSFSNANGVSFGLNGNTLTASVQPAAADGYNSAQFTNSTANSTMPILWAGNSNGSGNVTIGLTGSTVTMSAAGAAQSQQPMYFSASGTNTSANTLQFGNSNGISFSLSNGSVVGTVKTDYQSQGAYLTTAMVSNAGSNFVGLNSALTANGVSASINSSGISLNFPAFLTTAAQSNHSHGNPTLNLTNINGTTASASNGLTLSLSAVVPAQTVQPVAYSAANGSANFSTITFANSNGVSFSTGTQGVYATVATNYQSQGAYLTTARASTDAVGLNTAQSNVTWTVNSSGLSIDARGYAGTGTTFAGTNVSATMGHNSNGLALSLSAPSGGAGTTNQTGPNIADGANTITSGTVVFANSNNITFGLNGSTMTASFDPIDIGVSNVGNTAGTTGTINGRGAQYLFAGGSNVTVSQSLNGASGTLSIVVNNDDFNAWNIVGNNTAGTTGSTITTQGALYLSGGNNVTLSGNSNTIVISAAAGGGGNKISFFENVPVIHGTQTFNAVSSTVYVYPFFLQEDISIGFVRLPMSVSFAPTTGGLPGANSTISGQMGYTNGVVIYSQGVGANSNSLQSYASTSGTGSFFTSIGAGAQSSQMTVTVNGSFNQSGSQTNLGTGTSYGVSSGSYVVNSSAMSNFTGPRFADIPFATSLAAGVYWIGIGRSWSSANNSTIFNGVNPLSSNIFISQTNITWGIMGSATNTSNIMRQPGAGYFTTNASLFATASINAVGQVSVTTSNLVPYFQFINKA